MVAGKGSSDVLVVLLDEWCIRTNKTGMRGGRVQRERERGQVRKLFPYPHIVDAVEDS